MHDKLREYVEMLFKGAPAAKQITEIKEEIIQNTIDRYDDLVRAGKTPESAFHIAVSGIGDVSELIGSVCGGTTGREEFQRPPASAEQEIEKSSRKSGILLAISVMLYILSIIPVILLSGTRYEDTLGVCMMFLMIAAATGILIVRGKTNPQAERAQPDRAAEEASRMQSPEMQRRKKLRKRIEAALWCVTIVLYLLLSFYSGKWYITWVIFLVAAAAENIVRACFDLKR